ncbi:MAG: fumarate reductase subunit C [Gemmatimonadota bacterium]
MDRVNERYRLYHPKWHRRRIPIFWWLGKASYTRFIARELTSLFVAYAAVVLAVQLLALARGEAAYSRFAAWLGSGPVLVAHGIVLLVVLFHTITWLSLAPKALVIRLRGRRLPDRVVVAGHYTGWAAASALVAWFLLGG